jgi:hypothetical protein
MHKRYSDGLLFMKLEIKVKVNDHFSFKEKVFKKNQFQPGTRRAHQFTLEV